MKKYPFIQEPYPGDYAGYPFLALIQHRGEHLLGIVDNFDAKTIRMYVLDLCHHEQVDEKQVINIACEWFDTNRNKYPLSIEFSKRKVTSQTSKIHRTFNVESVTRIIGPVFCFPMNVVYKIKRRKRREINVPTKIV